jgi:hypothetical protein
MRSHQRAFLMTLPVVDDVSSLARSEGPTHWAAVERYASQATLLDS